jgi:hypothetical protein
MPLVTRRANLVRVRPVSPVLPIFPSRSRREERRLSVAQMLLSGVLFARGNPRAALWLASRDPLAVARRTWPIPIRPWLREPVRWGALGVAAGVVAALLVREARPARGTQPVPESEPSVHAGATASSDVVAAAAR